MTRRKADKAKVHYMTYAKMRYFTALPVSKQEKRENLVMYTPIVDAMTNIPSLWPDEKMDCLDHTVSYIELGHQAALAYQEALRLGKVCQQRPAPYYSAITKKRVLG